MKKNDTYTAWGRGLQKSAEKTASIISKTFEDFGVGVEVDSVDIGVHRILCRFKLLAPIRMKKIASFEEDLKYALGSDSIEILAPIPGEKLIGVSLPIVDEIPRFDLSSAQVQPVQSDKDRIVLPIGVDDSGQDTFFNLTESSHILVAGTTGSGKSTLIHTFITTLIDRNSPDQLRFIMVDPKMIELTVYNGIPHLLTPVIVDAKRAIRSIKWLIREMDRRFEALNASGHQTISSYHDHMLEYGKEEEIDTMPYIVLVVDEFADLMSVFPSEVEASIVQLIMKCRGAGIYMILATQRPEVKVTTGLIKANLPTHIALKVRSIIDSRTILDEPGAEKLGGKGDLLMQSPISITTKHFQGYFIDQKEIKRKVKQIKKTAKDTEEIQLEPQHRVDSEVENEDLYDEAKAVVIKAGKASTSTLQRALRIGYSRAARLIDILEEQGVIGPSQGSSPREIIGDNKT